MNKLVGAVPDGYALISIEALKAWGKYDEVRNACHFPAEQAEQEPVAWWNGKETAWFEHELDGHTAPDGCTIPLYTAPVRTKDLTDDEISDAIHGKGSPLRLHDYAIRDFRAVIAADREKNK